MKVPVNHPAATAALEQARAATSTRGAERTEGSGSIREAFSSLIETGQVADQRVAELATGQSVDVHNTMAQLGQADLELRFAVQLRNRALAAYEEIMRLQV